MSFDDVPIFMYRGSRAIEIASGVKNCVLQPVKMARNDQIDEFWRRLNFCLSGVTSLWNHPLSKKLCDIAHENGQKWTNRCVLTTSQFSCTRGHEQLKSPPEPKTVCYSPWKRPEMTKLMTSQFSCTRGSRAFEIVPGAKKKLCAIAQENGQKWPNRWF